MATLHSCCICGMDMEEIEDLQVCDTCKSIWPNWKGMAEEILED